MNDCIGLELRCGAIVLIDAGDLDVVNGHLWRVQSYQRKCGPNYYAVGPKCGRANKTLMHRMLMGLMPDDERCVDHINGNGLDNRRENLRVATYKQNNGNRRTFCNPLGFKGVYQRKGGTTYFSMLGDDYLGAFKTAQEAANAYDAALISKYGSFASTNALLRQAPSAPPQPSVIVRNGPIKPRTSYLPSSANLPPCLSAWNSCDATRDVSGTRT